VQILIVFKINLLRLSPWQIILANCIRRNYLDPALFFGGAATAAEFSASKNIKGLHVLFQPEVKTDTTGQRRKTFVTGCTVQEAPKNDVDTTKSDDDSGNSYVVDQPSNGGAPTGGEAPGEGD
jgi:hypothetical protein